MTAKVSLLPTESYDWALVRDAVEKHFTLLGVSIEPDRPVVLKPNLILRCGPERAATFHPMVLEAVLAQLRDMGIKNIAVAESPGGPFTPGLLKALFDKTGIAQAAAKYYVPCITETQGIQRRREENLLCRAFDIIAPVTEDVFLIDLCKVKTHCMMTFSGGVKNLFGCVPGLLKPQLHYRFPEEEQFAAMLVDLAETLHPDLVLADGVVGMEGDGPTAGNPCPLGITAAAPYGGLYALDLLLCRMIGLDPAFVPTVTESQRRGLCPEPVILGDAALARKITPFRRPRSKTLDFAASAGIFGPLVRHAKPWLAPRPSIRKKSCIGCGQCAGTCPAGAIVFQDYKAQIDPRKCIRCFCCHEMCPERAVHVWEPPFFRWFSK